MEKDENSKTEPQGVKMLCIWHKVNHDGDHFESWVPAAISRKTCPQKMLDFFLVRFIFLPSLVETVRADAEELMCSQT